MKRLFPTAPCAACAAIALAAGTTTTASAVDKHWVHVGNSSWNTPSNWSPAGVPAAADNVNIGNVAGVQNSTVLLNVNGNIADLDITDGMTLDTNLRTLAVGLAIDISGRNTVGTSVFPSRLVVDQSVAGAEVITQALTVINQGEVQLVGGGLLIDSHMNIGENSFLRGAGTVTLDSNFTNLRNGGTIAANGVLAFYQTGTGLYDLDDTSGGSGGGDLDLTAASNSSLTFNGDGIFEAFGGTLSMIRGTLLDMNLGEPWRVEPSGTFNIYGSGSGSPARIAGAPLKFDGTMNLYGGSQFKVDADVTFGTTSELITGLNVTADIAGDAAINGGLFTINEGSNLDFDGATIVRGGAFSTHSDESTTGSVDFNGPTEWDGNINVSGYARQNGPAHVTGPTVISGDTFDMDGSNDADWDIDANLTLNVDRMDFSGSIFSNTLDVVSPGRINVNLTNPDETWVVAGTMNLAGNSLAFSTKIGGNTPFRLLGVLNVSGKNDIISDAGFYGGSTVNIASATSALRFMSRSVIYPSVIFTGSGMIQTGASGTMVLDTGLNTAGVGVGNAGRLFIGASGAGIVSVDRFQTSGIWDLDIGGYNAGTGYDRLVSNGPATLGGTLKVDLINGFRPNVGDEFTILNAVGGITGAFAPKVTSAVGSTTYFWDVIVGSADVVLRLASIQLCPADFDRNGFVNADDFDAYVEKFVLGSDAADFDGNGFVNADDYDAFVTAFEGGC